MTTRSYRSRILLHSISTSVVLPLPTGPPTPTLSGGMFLLRIIGWVFLSQITAFIQFYWLSHFRLDEIRASNALVSPATNTNHIDVRRLRWATSAPNQ